MKKFFISTLMTIAFLINSAVITSAANAEYILNSAELNPTYTGFEPCDKMINYTLYYVVNDSMSTYEKVKACYDYLIDYSSYGDNVERLKYLEYVPDYLIGAGRACGMLEGHIGACDDYSCAFAALVRAIGLNCYTVYGQTSRASGGMTGHIWTVINVDGEEYIFDPQIDDNISKGGQTYYYRFCKTYDEVSGCYAPAYYDKYGYFQSF
ncbi:MAG: transglutaminase domain-containing protein [Selenomonadaceae bacterium]|nr:transglutaminase domain-containing protein [Selenomonadaceae bacterium]